MKKLNDPIVISLQVRRTTFVARLYFRAAFRKPAERSPKTMGEELRSTEERSKSTLTWFTRTARRKRSMWMLFAAKMHVRPTRELLEEYVG